MRWWPVGLDSKEKKLKIMERTDGLREMEESRKVWEISVS